MSFRLVLFSVFEHLLTFQVWTSFQFEGSRLQRHARGDVQCEIKLQMIDNNNNNNTSASAKGSKDDSTHTHRGDVECVGGVQWDGAEM